MRNINLNRSGGGGGGGVAGANTVPVTVTTTDAFAQGDLVFKDYRTGGVHNLNGVAAAAALAAGPATLNYVCDQASSVAARGTTQVLADGSTVFIMASNTAGPAYRMVAYRYTASGALIGKNVIGLGGSDSMNQFKSALLTNGNIAFTFYSGNTTTYQWGVLSPTLQLLYSGAFSGTSNASGWLQACAGGAFVFASNAAIERVSASGAQTTVQAIAGSASLGIQDEFNDNSQYFDTPGSHTLVDFRPVAISGGGFGFFNYDSTGCYYTQLNSDGTLRAAKQTLHAWGSQSIGYFRVARSATTGNIMWAISPNSLGAFYGIVADNGGVVLAPTAAAAFWAGGKRVRLVSDALGGFLLFGETGTPSWSVNYMSATGVPKATYPKPTGLNYSNDAGWNSQGVALVQRLTTGTVFITNETLYLFKYVFIDNAGTISPAVSIFNFVTGVGGANYVSALVHNDKVWGVASTGAGGSADQALFSIDNAGVLDVAPAFSGVATVVNVPPRVFLDLSGLSIHTAVSNATQTAICGFDLNKGLLQTYVVANNLAGCKARNYGYSFLFMDATNGTGQSVTPANAAVLVKPKATIMLGVASSTAAVQSALIVNTKGVFSTTSKAAQNFDHSANNPAGNKGSISNGLINLAGF